jgi:hypothetical protein
MKEYLIATLLVFQFCFSGAGAAQEYLSAGKYRLVRSYYDSALVEGIDASSLVKLFDGFSIRHVSAYWYWGRVYHLSRDSDGVNAILQVGVYPTVPEAEKTCLDYLNDVTAFFTEGSVRGTKIGDNCWFNEFQASGESKPWLDSITFIRKNVLVMLTSGASRTSNFIDILPVAQTIDSMIVNGSAGVMMKDRISLPEIISVQSNRKELREGETATVSVSAVDPKGKKLEYQGYGTKTGENTFFIRYSRDNTPAQYFGTTQTFAVWVVNEDNLFSRKKEFQITF